MTYSTDNRNNILLTNLNGEPTELTEDEIELLFDYRLADEDSRKELQELIENIKA